MDKYNLLSNLSIVILSYNKKSWLKKSINYWSKFNVDLIIIDGSDEKLENINKLNTNDSCQLRYFHVLGSYYQRLLFASKLSLKKYILMSCDDEIHLIQGVLESIRFLEKNTNFVASIGRCLKISIDSKNKLKEEIIYKRFEKVNKIVNVEEKSNRILSYFDEYICASYYSVIKSNLWKKNLNLICNLQLSSPYIYERLIELSNISQGRIFVHNKISWIRNGIIPPQIKSRSKSIYWWLKNNKLSHEHSEVLNSIKKITNLKTKNHVIFDHIFREKKLSLWKRSRLFLMDFEILVKINKLIKKLFSMNQLSKETTLLKKSGFLNLSEINEINNFFKTN